MNNEIQIQIFNFWPINLLKNECVKECFLIFNFKLDTAVLESGFVYIIWPGKYLQE